MINDIYLNIVEKYILMEERKMFIGKGNQTVAVENEMKMLQGKIVDDIEGIDDVEAIISFLNELANVNMFFKGVQKYIVSKGYSRVELEAKELIKVVIELFQKNNVVEEKEGKKTTYVSRNTISNWLTKNPPIDSLQSRDNVFALCFALELDIYETIEFFLKYYQAIPFDLRRIEECVYYYALRNDLKFQETLILIKEYKGNLVLKNTSNERQNDSEFTRLALHRIETISSKEDFESFMKDNMVYFNSLNEGAINKLELEVAEAIRVVRENLGLSALFTECNKEIKNYDSLYTLPKDKEKASEPNKAINVKTILEYITGISKYQLDKDKEDKESYKLKKISQILSRMPSKMRLNLPNEVILGSILNRDADKLHNADAIRKCLILFKFFNFYMMCDNPEDYYDDFLAEINSCLESCGYFQMYLRNPYDCMFLLSAMQEDPIYSFQTIIDRYLDFS